MSQLLPSDFDAIVRAARTVLRRHDLALDGDIDYTGRRMGSFWHEFPVMAGGEEVATFKVQLIGDLIVADYFLAGEPEPAIRVAELPKRLTN